MRGLLRRRGATSARRASAAMFEAPDGVFVVVRDDGRRGRVRRHRAASTRRARELKRMYVCPGRAAAASAGVCSRSSRPPRARSATPASCWRPASGSERRSASTARPATGAIPCYGAYASRPLSLCLEKIARLELRSGLRLLEQRLPALEQRSQRVAAALVRGERLDVRPVLGELRLELRHLGLAGGDLRLEPLELARRASRRLAARFGAFALLRLPARRGAARARRSSRRRSISAQPPS